MDEEAVYAVCPFCQRELAVFVSQDDVQISHAEPECDRFRRLCELERFEIVELAKNADREPG